MSEIIYEYVTQQDLIAESDFILVVSKKDPFVRYQKIPICEDKKCPDFIKAYYSFKLQRILYAKGDVPQDIIVVPANWEAEMEGHRLFYMEGVDESPVYMAYESSVDMHQATRLILFLNPVPWLEGMFIFSLEFAYESLDMELQITALIQKIKSKDV